jgi:hypothetical protein
MKSRGLLGKVSSWLTPRETQRPAGVRKNLALERLESREVPATLLVTTLDDSTNPTAPLTGSLREAVERRAQPGDTIQFATTLFDAPSFVQPINLGTSSPFAIIDSDIPGENNDLNLTNLNLPVGKVISVVANQTNSVNASITLFQPGSPDPNNISLPYLQTINVGTGQAYTPGKNIRFYANETPLIQELKLTASAKTLTSYVSPGLTQNGKALTAGDMITLTAQNLLLNQPITLQTSSPGATAIVFDNNSTTFPNNVLNLPLIAGQRIALNAITPDGLPIISGGSEVVQYATVTSYDATAGKLILNPTSVSPSSAVGQRFTRWTINPTLIFGSNDSVSTRLTLAQTGSQTIRIANNQGLTLYPGQTFTLTAVDDKNEPVITNSSQTTQSGIVVSYNQDNGELVFTRTAYTGSGTYGRWSIATLNAPVNASGNPLTNTVTVQAKVLSYNSTLGQLAYEVQPATGNNLGQTFTNWSLEGVTNQKNTLEGVVINYDGSNGQLIFRSNKLTGAGNFSNWVSQNVLEAEVTGYNRNSGQIDLKPTGNFFGQNLTYTDWTIPNTGKAITLNGAVGSLTVIQSQVTVNGPGEFINGDYQLTLQSDFGFSQVTTANITNGGTGYRIGDIITQGGNNQFGKARFQVDSVNSAGSILGLSVVNPGSNPEPWRNTFPFSGGTGTGLTLSFTPSNTSLGLASGLAFTQIANNSAPFTIQNLHFGKSKGSAIFQNLGNLSIQGSLFDSDATTFITTAAGGGAGELTIKDSTFRSLTSGTPARQINYMGTGPLTINASQFTGARERAIEAIIDVNSFQSSATVNIDNSGFYSSAGGIYTNAFGVLINNSYFTDMRKDANTSNGAVVIDQRQLNGSSSTISNSYFARNLGVEPSSFPVNYYSPTGNGYPAPNARGSGAVFAFGVNSDLSVLQSVFKDNSVNGVTITGSGGGAIFNYAGKMTVDQSGFLNNSVSVPDPGIGATLSRYGGGAIYSDGNSVITNSFFQGNQLTSGASAWLSQAAVPEFAGGGAVYLTERNSPSTSESRIANSTFTDNSVRFQQATGSTGTGAGLSGGAILISEAVVNLINDTVTGNTLINPVATSSPANILLNSNSGLSVDVFNTTDTGGVYNDGATINPVNNVLYQNTGIVYTRAGQTITGAQALSNTGANSTFIANTTTPISTFSYPYGGGYNFYNNAYGTFNPAFATRYGTGNPYKTFGAIGNSSTRATGDIEQPNINQTPVFATGKMAYNGGIIIGLQTNPNDPAFPYTLQPTDNGGEQGILTVALDPLSPARDGGTSLVYSTTPGPIITDARMNVNRKINLSVDMGSFEVQLTTNTDFAPPSQNIVLAMPLGNDTIPRTVTIPASGFTVNGKPFTVDNNLIAGQPITLTALTANNLPIDITATITSVVFNAGGTVTITFVKNPNQAGSTSKSYSNWKLQLDSFPVTPVSTVRATLNPDMVVEYATAYNLSTLVKLLDLTKATTPITGTVELRDKPTQDGKLYATATINGSATQGFTDLTANTYVSPNLLPVGTGTYYLVYSGNKDFARSASDPFTIQVNAAPTTLSLSAGNPNPQATGSTVIFSGNLATQAIDDPAGEIRLQRFDPVSGTWLDTGFSTPINAATGPFYTLSATFNTPDFYQLRTVFVSNETPFYSKVGESNTSFSFGNSGTETILANSGLHLTTGDTIRLRVDDPNLSNPPYQDAVVQSYNPATGSLVFTKNGATGSGTYSRWNIEKSFTRFGNATSNTVSQQIGYQIRGIAFTSISPNNVVNNSTTISLDAQVTYATATGTPNGSVYFRYLPATGTSDNSFTLAGSGTSTITVETGLTLPTGLPIQLVATNSNHVPVQANNLIQQATVTSYDPASGQLTFTKGPNTGNGTYSHWALYAQMGIDQSITLGDTSANPSLKMGTNLPIIQGDVLQLVASEAQPDGSLTAVANGAYVVTVRVDNYNPATGELSYTQLKHTGYPGQTFDTWTAYIVLGSDNAPSAPTATGNPGESMVTYSLSMEPYFVFSARPNRVEAVYLRDPATSSYLNFGPSSPPVDLNVTGTVTWTTIQASPTVSSYGTPVTFTATVSPSGLVPFSLDENNHSGFMSFYANGTFIGQEWVTLNQYGVPQPVLFTSSQVNAGSPIKMTAQYSGDGVNYLPSDPALSNFVNITVNQAVTALNLQFNPPGNRLPTGQTIGVAAQISQTNPAGPPVGQLVQFYATYPDGTRQPIGPSGGVPVNSAGMATLPGGFITTQPGQYSFEATFAGDGNYSPSSTVSFVEFYNPTQTSINLGITPGQPLIEYGTPVTFTATVFPTTAGGVGTVTILNGSTPIYGPVNLPASSQVTYTPGTNLAPGSYTFSAQYSGDTVNFTGATSQPVSVTIGKATTNLNLTADPAITQVDKSVTLTAKLSTGTTNPVPLPGGVIELWHKGIKINSQSVSGSALPLVTTFVVTPGAQDLGTQVYEVRYGGDSLYTTSVAVASVTVSREAVERFYLVAPQQGSFIQVYDRVTNRQVNAFQPLGNSYTGGFTLAKGDVNGDGIYDMLYAPVRGGQVTVLNGKDYTPIGVVNPFGTNFPTRLSIAVGDINGDGFGDIITAPGGPGLPPHVIAMSGRDLAKPLFSQYAYSAQFLGGVSVAAGDTNGDGFQDIITAPMAGAQPHIVSFSGLTGETLTSYYAYENYLGGVSITAEDLNHDGFAEIITAAQTAAPHVVIVDSKVVWENRFILDTLPPSDYVRFSQYVYAPNFGGGVRVTTVADINGDGIDDIVVAPGPGAGPNVMRLNGAKALLNKLEVLDSFFAYGSGDPSTNYLGGTYLG